MEAAGGGDEDIVLDYRYLGLSAATAAAGGVLAVAIGLGLAAVGTGFGGGMLVAAGVGALGLLAFFGAITAEPGAGATAEPLIATGDPRERGDRGFAVSHALLWLSLGMIVGGAVGVWTVF